MVTVVEGGSAPFTIAASARAIVERRTMPGESAAGFAGEVEQILAGLATAGDGRDHPDGAPDCDRAGHPTTPAATVRLTHAREAWQRAASGPSADLAEDLAAALAAHGHPCGSFAAPYWMESALWEAHGIPTLVCGPAGGGLHAVDEWVSLDQVRIYRAALVEAILAWGSR
jgi:acetylornithine deacetylase